MLAACMIKPPVNRRRRGGHRRSAESDPRTQKCVYACWSELETGVKRIGDLRTAHQAGNARPMVRTLTSPREPRGARGTKPGAAARLLRVFRLPASIASARLECVLLRTFNAAE